MFVMTLKPNGERTQRFVQYTFLFLILEDLHLYLMFPRDYAESPKIKKKKIVMYILVSQ